MMMSLPAPPKIQVHSEHLVFSWSSVRGSTPEGFQAANVGLQGHGLSTVPDGFQVVPEN